MLLSRPIPTLFGRLTSLQSEHERLHSQLERVRALCGALLGQGESPPPAENERVDLIVEWQAQLSRHFAAEESSRYFGTFVVERPALITRVAELRAEHAEMRDTLELLTRLAGDPLEVRAFAARSLRLIEQLERHEQVESELMREFLEQES